jgi:hypothetical protein
MPCVDVPQELDAAERAIVDARLEDAGGSLERIAGAVAARPDAAERPCARLDAPTVARFWLAEGAAASLSGSSDAAARAFQAAARVDAARWTPAFGATLRAEWEWAAQLPTASAAIALEPATEGWPTWLDGLARAFPADTTAGLHLVQIGEPPAWGAIVLVPANETFVVRVPDLGVALAPDATLEPAPRRHPRAAFVAGGAVCVAAGGALAWMAEQKDDDLARAGDLDELHQARRSQQTLGALAYSLLGVGAAGIVVGVAW